VGDGVEPGRQSVQFDLRGVLGEGIHQPRPPTGVAGAHAAKVPVVAAGLDQGGERELVEPGGAAVVEILLLGDHLGQLIEPEFGVRVWYSATSPRPPLLLAGPPKSARIGNRQ
jgi:hypothetical protein